MLYSLASFVPHNEHRVFPYTELTAYPSLYWPELLPEEETEFLHISRCSPVLFRFKQTLINTNLHSDTINFVQKR